MWRLREGVPEAVSKEGKAYKYDVSVPLSSFEDVVNTVREHLRKQGLLHDNAVKHVVGYGHVGDGMWTHRYYVCITLICTFRKSAFERCCSSLYFGDSSRTGALRVRTCW